MTWEYVTTDTTSGVRYEQQQQQNWRYSGPTLERLCVGQSKERDWRGRTMQGRGR